MSSLQVSGLEVSFGAVKACDAIDLTVDPGEMVAIIGPNGSGKTTLFRAICGDIPLSRGKVWWNGRDVTRKSTDWIGRRGLVRTFQQSAVFPSVTVRDNLHMAYACANGLRRIRRHSEARPDTPASPKDLLTFTGLDAVADQSAGAQPTGVLRIIGIALALMTRPAMLMLDEPAAGLNVEESARLSELLVRLNDVGLTLAVVDHDMSFIRPLCRRLVVLDTGRKLAEGAPEDVLRNEDVVRVYLGDRFALGKTGGAVSGGPR